MVLLRKMKETRKENINSLHIDGTDITDPLDIAESINSHFSNIASKIDVSSNSVDAQTLSSGDFYQSLNTHINELNPLGDKFEIPLIDEGTVFKELRTLPLNKSTGLDGLSARSLKISAPEVTKSFNASIRNGVFPDILETCMCHTYL